MEAVADCLHLRECQISQAMEELEGYSARKGKTFLALQTVRNMDHLEVPAYMQIASWNLMIGRLCRHHCLLALPRLNQDFDQLMAPWISS
jgi:hypothetical protein